LKNRSTALSSLILCAAGCPPYNIHKGKRFASVFSRGALHFFALSAPFARDKKNRGLPQGAAPTLFRGDVAVEIRFQ